MVTEDAEKVNTSMSTVIQQSWLDLELCACERKR